MWRSGISLVTWYLMPHSPYWQGGLYFVGGGQYTAKPALQAFRFPAFAESRADGVFVWGRTPRGRTGEVAIEQEVGRSWRLRGVLQTNQRGIFRVFDSPRQGWVRARIPGGEESRSFSLTPVRDQLFPPFGGPPLEPHP